mmetsp:Transcript_2480/g.5700  ORF Transcript_2480/g.5700 Transcript_2480/m.5700 type:complete len:126 (+) Transcript_2480:278-655(+)
MHTTAVKVDVMPGSQHPQPRSAASWAHLYAFNWPALLRALLHSLDCRATAFDRPAIACGWPAIVFGWPAFPEHICAPLKLVACMLMVGCDCRWGCDAAVVSRNQHLVAQEKYQEHLQCLNRDSKH